MQTSPMIDVKAVMSLVKGCFSCQIERSSSSWGGLEAAHTLLDQSDASLSRRLGRACWTGHRPRGGSEGVPCNRGNKVSCTSRKWRFQKMPQLKAHRKTTGPVPRDAGLGPEPVSAAPTTAEPGDPDGGASESGQRAFSGKVRASKGAAADVVRVPGRRRSGLRAPAVRAKASRVRASGSTSQRVGYTVSVPGGDGAGVPGLGAGAVRRPQLSGALRSGPPPAPARRPGRHTPHPRRRRPGPDRRGGGDRGGLRKGRGSASSTRKPRTRSRSTDQTVLISQK